MFSSGILYNSDSAIALSAPGSVYPFSQFMIVDFETFKALQASSIVSPAFTRAAFSEILMLSDILQPPFLCIFEEPANHM